MIKTYMQNRIRNMIKTSNSHPIKVVEVEDEGVYANSRPVKTVGGVLDESITTEKLANKAVTPDKTDLTAFKDAQLRRALNLPYVQHIGDNATSFTFTVPKVQSGYCTLLFWFGWTDVGRLHRITYSTTAIIGHGLIGPGATNVVESVTFEGYDDVKKEVTMTVKTNSTLWGGINILAIG